MPSLSTVEATLSVDLLAHKRSSAYYMSSLLGAIPSYQIQISRPLLQHSDLVDGIIDNGGYVVPDNHAPWLDWSEHLTGSCWWAWFGIVPWSWEQKHARIGVLMEMVHQQ